MSRKTRNRLWRDLLKRSVAAPDARPTHVTHWWLPVLLLVLALYLFAKL
jgi:hypothetical protein